MDRERISTLYELIFHEVVQKQVVSAAIFSNEKLLVLRRAAHEPMGGLYELPGGTVDEGETMDGALVREVFEETALYIRQINDLVTMFDFFSRDNVAGRNYVYTVETEPGEVVIDPEEHDDYQYVSLDELSTYPLTENALKSIQALQALRGRAAHH